jgi:hypothetical protein
VAWKDVGNNSWESVSKANGKVTARDTLKLSADGKTLTDSNREMKLNGGSIDSTTVYSRVSGGPGLAGKWQTKKVSGSAGMIELIASGNDGLTFKDLEQGMTCEGKLDGKDYPCTGPMLPPGFTSAYKSTGQSLDLAVKKDGKTFFTATFTVSEDGKTLVETGSATTGGDKFKIVFDRI